MNTKPSNPGETNAVGGKPPDGVVVVSKPTAEASFDLWRMAHRALRGRYALALMLAAAGATGGALAGSMYGQRMYSATGLVRIASVLPPVMRETDQNKPIAMFDGIIEAQREKMVSRETVQAAMKEEPWQLVSRAGSSITEEQFLANLKVETRPRSDHLRVTFKNPDPDVTAAAVQSIIAAYQQVFNLEQSRNERQRMEQLQSRRATQLAELSAVEEQIDLIAQGHSAEEVEALFVATTDHLKKLRSALADVQFALAGGPDVLPKQGTPSVAPEQVADMELLRAYGAAQARAEVELAAAKSRGFGPTHREVVRLTSMIQECRDKVAAYTLATRSRRPVAEEIKPPVSLTERQATLQQLIDSEANGMSKLASQRTQLKAAEEQAAALRQSLFETDSRLDALATESALGNRLFVVSGGEKPLTAVLDNRAKYAGVGAAAGMMLPVGVLVLRGVRRRRYRYCDELTADLFGRVPFITALPDLVKHHDLGANAAHAVHDLRVRLQPRGRSEQRNYLITSATPGEGKSGLAIALGLSFAAAGFKTLLIDGDLSSTRLTREFGLIDEPGLIEATDAQPVVLRRTRAGLSVLGVGHCSKDASCRLAPAATGRVLTDIRERFDVVLVDSDSILSGLAASVIAPHVDGVILSVDRGQEESLLRSAIERLELLSGVLTAAVFNRADAADFRTSPAALPPTASAEGRVMPDQLKRFGPTVAAVLKSLSLSRENDLDLVPLGVTLAKSEQRRAVA